MRLHGKLATWTDESGERHVGKTTTGHVYEQKIGVTHPKLGEVLILRRIRLVLFEKTRDGMVFLFWGEIALLTNLTKKSASAIFAFCLAAILYSAVLLMKSSIAAVHGEEALENISWYYAYTETHATWQGMEIALPFEFSSKRIDGMSKRELSGNLKTLSGKIHMAKFTKSRRGPKKKVTKTYDPKVNHVSTFKVLQERKSNEK